MRSRLNWFKKIFMSPTSLLLLIACCVAIRLSFGNYYHHIRISQLLSTFVPFEKPTPVYFNVRFVNFAPPRRGWFTIALVSLPLELKTVYLKRTIFEKLALCRCIPSPEGAGVGFIPEQQNLLVD